MYTFLITYSDAYHAEKDKLPLIGSTIQFASIEELLAYVDGGEGGHKRIIILEAGYHPAWTEWADLDTEEERRDKYRTILPEEWKQMRWIEVYNGLRE